MEPKKAESKGQTKRELTEGEKELLIAAARQVADAIDDALPEGVGFGLFLFALGPSGFMSWISRKIDRKETLRAIEAWLAFERESDQEGQE